MDRAPTERKRAPPKRYREEEEETPSPTPTHRNRKVTKRPRIGNGASQRSSSVVSSSATASTSAPTSRATSASTPAPAFDTNTGQAHAKPITGVPASVPPPAISINTEQAHTKSSTAVPEPAPVPQPAKPRAPPKFIFRHPGHAQARAAPPPPRNPPLTWQSIERVLSPERNLREVEIGNRSYPFNGISLLRESALLLLLKTLSTLFPLTDVYKLLHLEDDEIKEIGELLEKENRRVVYPIEESDGRFAERILRAHVREGEALEGLMRRLKVLVDRFVERGEVMLEDVERIRMTGLNVERWR
ncbi:hypothetical protein VTL71DRAFT_7342 [Oculimacula yallundae]|uniref:Uncharacterized protein n=1 Tax=Oculimacula yallundae TaxID=86028 RepID=A0ABR4BWE3_9HELO